MKKIGFWIKKHYLMILITIVIISIGFTILRPFLPYTDNQRRKSVTMVMNNTWNEIMIDGKTVAYCSMVDCDTAIARISLYKDSVQRVSYHSGCWLNKWLWIPSCHGRIITAINNGYDPRKRFNTKALLAKVKTDIDEHIKRLKAKTREIGYYKRVHGVTDEGYGMIATYNATIERELKEMTRISEILAANTDKAIVNIVQRNDFTAYYRDDNDKLCHSKCEIISNSFGGNLVIVQTVDKQTPDGVVTLSTTPWTFFKGSTIMAVGFAGINEPSFANTSAKPFCTEGTISNKKHNIPSILANNGSPVFSKYGTFIGIINNGNVDDKLTNKNR